MKNEGQTPVLTAYRGPVAYTAGTVQTGESLLVTGTITEEEFLQESQALRARLGACRRTVEMLFAYFAAEERN